MKMYRPYKQFTAHGQLIATLEEQFKSFKENNNSNLLKPIVVFTAFAIESYLNHLGAEHISIWDELERLPWKKKITILYKLTEKAPNWGEQPLQFAQQVFTLRDKLAHGKPEIVYGPICDTEDEADDLMREPALYIPDWYKSINSEWVIDAEKRFDELITHLGYLFGRGNADRVVLAYTGIQEIDD